MVWCLIKQEIPGTETTLLFFYYAVDINVDLFTMKPLFSVHITQTHTHTHTHTHTLIG